MNVNNFNFKVGSHEEIKKLAKRVGRDIGTLRKLITTTREELVAAINDLKQEQSDITGRIEVLEELHKKPVDQGPASEYPGIGWYKATDTGIVYNKGVPEGETHVFSDGDPTEYISVWGNNGIDPDTFDESPEAFAKLRDWHLNAHRYATSNVTDMSYWMFGYGDPSFYPEEEIKSLPRISLAHYDTSNVTNLEMAFAQSTVPVDLGENWDTSSATNMGSMFRSALSFNQDLSQWCVPNITEEPQLFDNAAAAWTLPRPVWGTCPRGEDQA